MKKRSESISISPMIKQTPTHSVGVYSESIAHKISEYELIKNDELYVDLVTKQSAGIYRMVIKKHEGEKSIRESAFIEYVSDQFCELFEIDRKEFSHDAISAAISRIHPDDLQLFIKSNEIAQHSLLPYIGELRLLIDGRIKWLRFESSPLKLNDESTSWTGVVVDITREKLADEAIRINEEKYRMLIEMATDAFFQGDRDGNFIAVNLIAVEQTGYSKDELMRMNMKDLFSVKMLSEKPLQYDQLIKGDVVTVEREMVRKDGARIPVEMSSRMMPDGTFQSFFRNISERKRTEKTLKRKLNELEIYYELAITRERKMIALKGEINQLLERLGEKLKY